MIRFDQRKKLRELPASQSEVGMFSFNANTLIVLNNLISVKNAAPFSGYGRQYIPLLLRSGKLSGLNIGQLWLIDKQAFDS